MENTVKAAEHAGKLVEGGFFGYIDYAFTSGGWPMYIIAFALRIVAGYGAGLFAARRSNRQ